MFPPLDPCVDARAAYDAISATVACEFAGSSLKLHLISVRDRMTHGLVRKFFWVDIGDMLADGAAEGGIGRALLHIVSNDCRLKTIHECLGLRNNSVVGSAARLPKEEPLEKEGP